MVGRRAGDAFTVVMVDCSSTVRETPSRGGVVSLGDQGAPRGSWLALVLVVVVVVVGLSVLVAGVAVGVDSVACGGVRWIRREAERAGKEARDGGLREGTTRGPLQGTQKRI